MKKYIAILCILVMSILTLLIPICASAASKLSLRSVAGDWVVAKTNFKLIWNRVDSAKTYKIKAYNTTTGETLVNKKLTGTSYTINGSSVGYSQKVQITVSALNNRGKTIDNETIMVCTNAGVGSCTTKSATVKKGGTVVLNFSVDTNGGKPVKDYGVIINGRKYSMGYLGSKKGSFTYTVYNYPAGKYTYKAFVTNEYGTTYGTSKTFRVK